MKNADFFHPQPYRAEPNVKSDRRDGIAPERLDSVQLISENSLEKLVIINRAALHHAAAYWNRWNGWVTTPDSSSSSWSSELFPPHLDLIKQKKQFPQLPHPSFSTPTIHSSVRSMDGQDEWEWVSDDERGGSEWVAKQEISRWSYLKFNNIIDRCCKLIDWSSRLSSVRLSQSVSLTSNKFEISFHSCPLLDWPAGWMPIWFTLACLNQQTLFIPSPLSQSARWYKQSNWSKHHQTQALFNN